MDVIKYVMRGKTMREIGVILGLSRRTIESYFEKIKMKANVKTRSELFDKLAAF
jgi:DNA-binding CsgD family transcriptional regulator